MGEGREVTPLVAVAQLTSYPLGVIFPSIQILILESLSTLLVVTLKTIGSIAVLEILVVIARILV